MILLIQYLSPKSESSKSRAEAEANRMFPTPVGFCKFVKPVVFLVHDPNKHVGWFFALKKAPIKKMPTPSNSQSFTELEEEEDPILPCVIPTTLLYWRKT